MPVVVMHPAIQHRSALPGVVIRSAVSPLAQGRLDEALGFAVGLWPFRSSEVMSEPETTAGRSEPFRAEHGAIVGEDPTHLNAQPGKALHAGSQEGHRAGPALAGLHLRKAKSSMVVD